MVKLHLEIPGFEPQEEIARGGYSILYRGVAQGKSCVVKVLKNEVTGAKLGDASRFFFREGTTLARLRHPGVVQVFEVGKTAAQTYVVMEHVEGSTLTDVLSKGRPSEDMLIEWTKALASALAEVHRCGLVHRDIKPDNIIIDRSQSARLIDFGFATEATRNSQQKEIVGSFRYSAPEQSGTIERVVDGRSDLYSLGIVLYEAVTGRPPFRATDIAQLLQEHATVVPPSPVQLNPNLSTIFSLIIEKLIVKDPDDRYQSAIDLNSDLERIHLLTAELAKGKPPRLGQISSSSHLQNSFPIVGREQELLELTQSWNRSREGHGTFHLIVGEAGFGKSRLIQEVEQTVKKEKGLALSAKCNKENPIPMAVWRDLIDSIPRSCKNKSPEEKQKVVDEIKKAAGEFLPQLCQFSSDLSEFLGRTRSGNTAQGLGEQFGHILVGFLTFLSRELKGLLITLEDLHWMDPSSVRVLKILAKELNPSHLMVLASCRTDEPGSQIITLLPSEVGPKNFRSQSLGPLSDVGITKLIQSLLGGHKVAEEALAQIAFRTKGNAFAVIEYIRTLLDEGLLSFSWGKWSLDARALDSISLSADLVDLLHSRVSKLQEKTREILKAAAVTGSEFSAKELSTITDIKAHQVSLAINEAFQARLVERITFDQFRFVHDRVREVLTKGVDSLSLKGLHEKISTVLDEKYRSLKVEERIGSLLYPLAYHFAQADSENQRSRTYETNLEAGLMAAKEYANQEAFTFLETARRKEIELKREPHVPLLETFGEVCFHIDEVDKGISALNLALKSAKNRLSRSRVRMKLATGYLSRLSIKEARTEIFNGFKDLRRPFARTALGQFFQTGWIGFQLLFTVIPVFNRLARGSRREIHKILVELYNVGTLVLYHNFEDLIMLQFSVRSLYSARRIGPSRELVSAYSRFSSVMAVMGLKGLARFFVKRAHSIAAKIEDKRAMAEARIFEAFSTEFSGDPAEAEELFRNAFVTCERWLDHNQFMDACFNTVMALRARGYMREVWIRLEKALERANEAFTPEGSGFVIFPSYRAATLASLGRMSEAMEAKKDVEKYLPTLANDKFNWTFYLIQRLILAMECSEGAEELNWIETQFKEKVGVSPWFALYHVRYYFLYAAYSRLNFCYQDAPTTQENAAYVDKFSRTLKDLRPSKRMPMFRAHYFLLFAHLCWLKGRSDSAQKYLRIAEEWANRVDQPWVTYEIQWLRAKILLKSGNRSAARRMATIAYQMAHENGWVNRSRKIFLEFSLDNGSQTSATSMQSMATGIGSGKLASAKLKRQLNALKEVSLASASILDPIPLAQIALDKIIRIVSAERAFLFIRDDKTGQLRMEAGRNIEGENLLTLTGFSSTVVRMAEADRKPILITGTEDGPVLATQSIVTNQLKSIVAVPLILKERLLGVMYLDSRLSKGAFTMEDLDVLNAIASHVAIAFETSRVAQMELERRKIKSAFQQYVSPEIVENLLNDPSQLSLSSERRELTVLFSDIRNFTSVSESLPPERLFELMNTYFTPMTKIILKSSGVIDKYIGDAMMAFWGAPLRLLDHADRAAHAALQMVEDLSGLNCKLLQKGFPAIQMGIGLNTGVMSVGNVGSEDRFSYTVLGDSVNLGSRLEGLTKVYGVPIVLSEYTLARFQSTDLKCRELDDVRVKGKNKPLRIFELVSSNACNGREIEFIELFRTAREAYRAQDWKKAEKFFSECLKLKADDKPSQLYLNRISKYSKEPPGAEWDGVTIFMRE